MRCILRIAAVLSLANLMFLAVGDAQQPTPYRLSLREAIQQALKNNVNVLTAWTQVDEAEAVRTRYHSALLPHVLSESYAKVQNLSLNAFGLTGIATVALPQVTGPFSNYDFRFYAQQSIIDLQSYHGWKASERVVDASKSGYEGALDLAILAVANLYLNSESAAARIEAAQSRVADSDALYKLAKDKHDAGTATGVDVLRAQVQLANDKQALLVAQNQYKQSLLALARNLGMSPATPLELAESLRYQPFTAPPAEVLLPTALLQRPDYLALASQRQAIVEQQRANRARYYPKLSIGGTYGEFGRSIGGVTGIGGIQAQIDVTVFDRDRTGAAQQIESQLRRVDYQIADLRRGIEEDIREALLNLQSTAEQVAVAKEGLDLAQRELGLTQDRFQAGTTNNVEVVTAQDELARAQENYILAVTSNVQGRFFLAAALADTKDIGN